jgi:hypothetical protein
LLRFDEGFLSPLGAPDDWFRRGDEGFSETEGWKLTFSWAAARLGVDLGRTTTAHGYVNKIAAHTLRAPWPPPRPAVPENLAADAGGLTAGERSNEAVTAK